VIRQPEPLLSKVNAVENIFYRLALFVQPGLQVISERDDQYIFVSQHSRKPHVVRRRSIYFCSIKLFELILPQLISFSSINGNSGAILYAEIL